MPPTAPHPLSLGAFALAAAAAAATAAAAAVVHYIIQHRDHYVTWWGDLACDALLGQTPLSPPKVANGLPPASDSPVSVVPAVPVPPPTLDHLYSVDQLTPVHLRYLFDEADAMGATARTDGTKTKGKGCSDRLRGALLANVFYEPSTRTSASFHAAMLRLGGGVIPVHASASSACKGETLVDTVRSLDRYCDVVVLRHPEEGSVREAADVARVPVLNAGDGVGEHPTQAVLDAYTIRRELGWGALKAEAPATPWRVTFVGDLKHGRTVHSLAKLLATHFHVTLRCVSPISLRLPDAVCDAVHATGTPLVDTTDLVGTLAETDVLYVTRIQKERFATAAEYEAVQGAYRIDTSVLQALPATGVVMHPLPRTDELHTDVDTDPRAAYFRQMEYGLHVRMALLAWLVEGGGRA